MRSTPSLAWLRFPAALIALLFIAASAHAQKIVCVAGGGEKGPGNAATECRLLEPFGVEFTASGEMVIVEMTGGNRVLKMDAKGVLHIIGGTGAKGYSGDGGPAPAATFNGIHNLAIAKTGDLLLSDSFNHVIRRIAVETGIVTTLSGTGKKGFAGDGGAAANAEYNTPIQISLDFTGKNLLVADIGNRRIRKIDLEKNVITTIAGNGQKGIPPDGADAASVPLMDPRGVIAAPDGGYYILERDGHALRHVDAAGKIRTVAGTGKDGFSSRDGPAKASPMNGPKHLCLDRDGTVLIADAENNVIRRYNPKTETLTRVAGTGAKGDKGVGGSPLDCQLNRPHGVTIGPDGKLYITDSYNDRILRIDP